MTDDAWCKSLRVPITAGAYTLSDGTPVEVVQARSGNFYARSHGKYVRGLIWQLRAELESERRPDDAGA